MNILQFPQYIKNVSAFRLISLRSVLMEVLPIALLSTQTLPHMCGATGKLMKFDEQHSTTNKYTWIWAVQIEETNYEVKILRKFSFLFRNVYVSHTYVSRSKVQKQKISKRMWRYSPLLSNTNFQVNLGKYTVKYYLIINGFIQKKLYSK